MARAAVAYMNARVKGAPSADVQNLVKNALSKDGELYYGNTKLKVCSRISTYLFLLDSLTRPLTTWL